MTDQTAATSWMRRTGAIALVAGALVFMANVSMARSQTAQQALKAGISHPLVSITIALGLFWLLRSRSHTAPTAPCQLPENSIVGTVPQLRPRARTAPPKYPDDFPSLEPPPPFN